MSSRALSAPQLRDPGSEGGAGYTYQWHVAARMCIQMLADKAVDYIVCEFHEDVVQIRRGLQLDFVEVKKRENGNWTLLDLTRPKSRQKQGILGKLLTELQKGKDVGRLLLVGCGRMSGDGDCSLLEFVGLLSTPVEGRDGYWQTQIQRHRDFLCAELSPQGITPETVSRAISVLEIDFSLPHPDGIEMQNRDLLDKTLRGMWMIDLTALELAAVYQSLFDRVQKVSTKPKQPWRVKAISREEVLQLVSSIVRNYAPALGRRELMTTQDKLTSTDLAQKATYALQKRLDAMQLRFELDIGAAQWEDMRTQIDMEWRKFRTKNPGVRGPALWQSLRDMLSELGKVWAKQDSRMGPDFAEGVFFDMTGTCEAEWRINA